MKKLRLITGIAAGLILGVVFGMFVINSALTILLMFLGIITKDASPPWLGTLYAFSIFLSMNMGIYLGIQWARRTGNNKTPAGSRGDDN